MQGNHQISRKYDDFTGRFFQIDPQPHAWVWEKYYGLTPYHYSANNPVSFLDPGGEEIIAPNKESQVVLKASLPINLRSFVKFDKRGMLNNKEFLNGAMYNMYNPMVYAVTVAAINHELTIYDVTDKIKFYKKSTDVDFQSYTSKDNIGIKGFTALPASYDGTLSSVDPTTIHIQINSEISFKEKIKWTGHEFGHALFYIFGLCPDHDLKNGKGNEPLEKLIQELEESAKENGNE